MYMHTHKLELQHTDVHIHKSMCSHLYFRHKYHTLTHTHYTERKKRLMFS